MNASQYDKVAPHIGGIEFFIKHGTNVLGSQAFGEIESVSQELGRMPTDMNCGACKANLLRMMNNIINEYKRA